ncbi:MAG: branched-chain amino acid ABC transporter permease, partial [Clostridia bacterium]|nr:branched-chain amino acid ABC transporter permease [Clostridia bacterium]
MATEIRRREAQPAPAPASVPQTHPGRGTAVVLLLVLAPVVTLPLWLRSAFYMNLATETLLFAVAAAGVDLLLGYTGMVSFGQAAFLGLGAYSFGVLSVRFHVPFWWALGAGVGIAGLTALLVGAISARAPGLGFTMLTLAFAQLIYTVGWKWRSLTGGDDGLVGIPRPQLGDYTVATPPAFYWFALVWVALAFYLSWRMVNSPFGAVLQAIRENADRVAFLGYNVYGFRVAVFAVGGALAGLAGALYASFAGFIGPGLLHWSQSGNLLVMTLIGGQGTLFGAVLGAS